MSDKNMVYPVEVVALEPIPGKDRIVLARIKDADWTVIVGKDEFKVGDKGVFFEVDTILPEKPEFEFLRKRCYSEHYRGHRIKSMKFKNEDDTFSYSQGLLMPLSVLPEKANMNNLMEVLGVRRVEDEIEEEPTNKSHYPKIIIFFDRILRRFGIRLINVKGKATHFPSDLISRTDETQAQNLGYVYESWKGKLCYSTVKMDGSSLSIIKYKDRFIVASRNQRLYDEKFTKALKDLTPKREDKYTKSPYLRMMCKLDLPAQFKKNKNIHDIAFQGELCGPAIQKNRMGYNDLRLFIFNAYDLKEKEYYSFHWMKHFCNELGLETVPFIEYKSFDFDNISDLRKYAEGEYENGHPREGVVIRLAGINHETDKFIPHPEKGMSNMASLKIINEKFREVLEKLKD